jgi:hypothetical protein
MPLRMLVLTLSILAVGTGSAAAQSRRTAFEVPRDAFNFSNTFLNIFVGDWTTNGLCGGMSYAALDFHNARRGVPRLDVRPANGTPFQQFIYNRQVNSIMDNLDRWAELGFNPGGVRSSEFFRWGLQGFGGGRLQELRERIDKGQPVPLGLYEYGEGTKKKSHQVLAIGYDLGGFTGTDRNHQFFGANAENLRIFIYDPNYPEGERVLRPDTRLQGFYYEGTDPDDRRNNLWRTYFVDGRYRPAPPPNVSEVELGGRDDLAREIRVDVKMGNQRLRGGTQNLDVTINYEDGPPQVVRNINGGHEWVNDYWEHVPIPLARPVHHALVSSVVLSWTGSGTFPVQGLSTSARGGFAGPKRYFWQDPKEGPLFTFTSDNRSYTMVNPDSLVLEVTLEIRSGPDDLLGGSHNVNVVVTGRGAVATLNNANAGRRWPGGSTQTVTATFSRPVRMADISSVSIIGPSGTATPWVIAGLRVRAGRAGGGPERVLVEKAGNPLHVFTDAQRSYLVKIQ